MSGPEEQCPACRQAVKPGASFCTKCGSPLSNRGARIERNISQVQMAKMDRAAHQPGPDAGSIAVAPVPPAAPGATAGQPMPQGPGGGMTMNDNAALVPASPGKRLGAAVLDWLGPAVLLGVAIGVGAVGITERRSNGFIVYDTGLLVLLGSIATGLTLVYAMVLLGIEARSGNTIGNRLMGIRSADADGYAPGGGIVFLRGLITGAVFLLTIIVAILVVALGWYGIALLILGPLMLLSLAWAVLVVVSNAWDKQGGLRGWHDKASKGLVFDVSAGRNPVKTGGIQGEYNFAPMDLPPVQQVSSPVAMPTAKGPAPVPQQPGQPVRIPQPGAPMGQAPMGPVPTNQAPVNPVPMAAPVPQAPLQPQPPVMHNPNQWQPPVAAPAPAGPLAPPSAAFPQEAHPDDDIDRTQLRPGAQAAAPAVLRIRLDDGQDFEVRASMLIGRNPAAMAGESVEQLVPVSDPGRSISKTHLQLRREGDGVWVTDRNSTNGSAVTTPDGVQSKLVPGEAVFVRPGSTVQFGDRTFHLGQA
ncbi:transporter [Arthrobacter sp. SW1]|uniref:RDD family protein n=1 Tax=Arthrobacter sp. SW1 TaxID=1920889 RepID=UPI000877C20C|nr:RDD family protein [Arthrobacter sp. SW1]OFI38721.1 transporter [Arthrobacter sp. SW1]